MDENDDIRTQRKYKFPIEETECYLELIKYDEDRLRTLTGEEAEKKKKENEKLCEEVYGKSYEEFMKEMEESL